MDFSEVPVGFGMALAKNEAAVNAYAMMTREQKQEILNRAHSIRTRDEMERLITDIAKDDL